MNLVELLDRYNVPHVGSDHHHVRKNWIGLDCPVCSPGWGKYRLGIEVTTGRVNCWNCGRLNGPQVFELILRVNSREAERLWHSIPRNEFLLDKDVERRGVLKNPRGVGDLLPQHRRYLEGRGFDPDAISNLWGVRGIGLANRLQWRLFIPIHDLRGNPISWTTRSIGAHDLRYISASPEEEAASIKSVIYGAHHAQHVAFISEGPPDAWAIGPSGVATCGVGYSAQQLALMSRYPVRVVCFDSQADAQRRADQLSRELSAYPGTTENVLLESGEDPASADPAEIQELRATYLG